MKYPFIEFEEVAIEMHKLTQFEMRVVLSIDYF